MNVRLLIRIHLESSKMIPKEKINKAAKNANDYSTANNYNAFKDGFECGVSFAETELQQIKSDKDDFIKYCKRERNKFVHKFWELHESDINERVMAEDLLIAYDQLLDRYDQ